MRVALCDQMLRAKSVQSRCENDGQRLGWERHLLLLLRRTFFDVIHKLPVCSREGRVSVLRAICVYDQYLQVQIRLQWMMVGLL